MDEYRQAVSTHVNPGYSSDTGFRLAEADRSFDHSIDHVVDPTEAALNASKGSSQFSESMDNRLYSQPKKPGTTFKPPTKAAGLTKGQRELSEKIQQPYKSYPLNDSANILYRQPEEDALFKYKPKWMYEIEPNLDLNTRENSLQTTLVSKKESKINTYLPLCVFLTVFPPFFPAGIVALLLSLWVKQLRDDGETIAAKKTSKILFLWLLFVPAIFLVIYILVGIIFLFCGKPMYSVTTYEKPFGFENNRYNCIFGGGIRQFIDLDQNQKTE